VKLALIPSIFVLAACAATDDNAAANAHVEVLNRLYEQEIAELENRRANDPAMPEYDTQMAQNPCVRRIPGGWEDLPPRDCVPLSAQQEMSGTWAAGMEDSTFVSENPDVDTRGERVWLEMELSDALRSGVMAEGTGPVGMFEIHFVGRRSRQRGHYGHLGMSPHVVVVDRIISVRRIGAYRYIEGLRYSDPP